MKIILLPTPIVIIKTISESLSPSTSLAYGYYFVSFVIKVFIIYTLWVKTLLNNMKFSAEFIDYFFKQITEL